MFDTNLLFSNAQAVTANAWSSYDSGQGANNGVRLYKTPAEGLWIEIAVTAVSGSGTAPTLAVEVKERDDTTWAAGTDTQVKFATITAVGRYFRHVQSKFGYLNLYYTVTGQTSPSFTVTAGVVSGPQRDATA